VYESDVCTVHVCLLLLVLNVHYKLRLGSYILHMAAGINTGMQFNVGTQSLTFFLARIHHLHSLTHKVHEISECKLPCLMCTDGMTSAVRMNHDID
jgi:hypothetical protein